MSGTLRWPALAAVVIAIGGTAVVSSTHVSSAGGGCAIPTGSIQATGVHDLFALAIGPMETMYSKSEAASKHPSSGEVMLGGAMSNVSGPAASVRHLEVHICSSDGSQVVQNAAPSITLTDTTANGAPQSLPVAVMQGVGQGASDLHYGNNVSMPAGHTYLVVVSAGADRAGFSFTLGDRGIVWGAPTNVAAATAPRAPATAATPAPQAMASMSPGAVSGMGGTPSPSAAPTPAAPPGTGAPTPHTGVLSDTTGAAGGLGAAFAGLVLCVRARRRRRAR